METTHLIIEFFGCDKEVLSRSNTIKDIFEESVKKAEFNKIKSHYHQFNPVGVTGFVLLRESHLSIHTWPEEEYAAIDVFTCGDKNKALFAVEFLAQKMEPKKVVVKEIIRGKPRGKKEKIIEKEYNRNKNLIFSKDIIREKTKFQSIVISNHPIVGKVMTLDDELQITEKEEQLYSRPFVTEAFRLRPGAKKVAILGNGDLGVLREVLSQPVEVAYVIEIDRKVIELAKKHFPEVVGTSVNDKRAKIVIGDCFRFLEKEKGFDIIFSDLTTKPITKENDPYIKLIELAKSALNPGGIIALQSGYAGKEVDKSIEDILNKKFSHKSKKTTDISIFGDLWAFNYGYD